MALTHALPLQDANLDVTETLFHDMFRDDVEIVKYKIMPGVQELIEEYDYLACTCVYHPLHRYLQLTVHWACLCVCPSSFEDKFKTSKAAFQQVGLEQHVKMAKEEADMRRSLLLVTTETNKHCITLVTDYRTQAKRVRAHGSCLNHSTTHPATALACTRQSTPCA